MTKEELREIQRKNLAIGRKIRRANIMAANEEKNKYFENEKK